MTARFGATVIDAGGGQVGLLIDRGADRYLSVGDHVQVMLTVGDTVTPASERLSKKFFATADIDFNSTYRDSDDMCVSWTLPKYVSRVVDMGELVLLVDTQDGEEAPFVTWGRVVGVREIVRFRHVGGATVSSGYLYVQGQNHV